MELDAIKLFDADDVQVGQVQMPKRYKGQAPRQVVWMGRKFVEGDGTGYYDYGSAAEVSEWPKI